ncbi:glycerophosphodiester phosphodiesterase family protein [Roseivirga sp.]|uniref:glycerophosphodiester phosphodiesterase family protein n=1 Tax=Roseivirga sp. TaxID=1964215 RepID=UPI003B529A84
MLRSKIALLLISLLCSVSLSAQEIDIQGHRGARGLMPENTIPAFIRALEEGVTTLELDVVITSDRRVLVSHEPFMSAEICLSPLGEEIKRSEQKEHNIFEMTAAETVLYDCGSKGNERFPKQNKMSAYKPLLVEVIDSVESYIAAKKLPNVFYNIEIKSSEAGDGVFHPSFDIFSDIVYGLLKSKLPSFRYTIQSFDFRVLKYFHESYEEVKLVALIENTKGVEANLEALGFVPEVYSPYHILLNEKAVALCHEKGMKVVPWTVNDRKRMEKLVEWGVDGIITDYPNLAKGLDR